ncbi:zeta toxin family protein [Orbus sturtevantii]|uniref:zeta toxin family protein n=1 Tax=Orbus sturtevantii TaxID=3074109 RepID=UPI00370D1687
MKNNESLSFVSTEQKEKIVNELWSRILAKNNLVQENSPHSYVMGGQPGAGKSTSTTILKEKFGNNIILIDLDQYRKEHPNYKALYEKYGKELSSYTHEFAGEIKEEIQKRAIDNRYNIIIDGTLGNVGRAEELIDNLKNKGYHVDIVIHTCPKEISWNSVNMRYENALKAGEIPRHVPKVVHDQIIEALPQNTDKLSQSKQIESLTIHNRQEKIYDSKIDKILPSLVVQAEINKNDKKLSKDNLAQSSNDIFAQVRQAAAQKLVIKQSLSDQKSTNKRIGKGIEK